MIKVGDIVLNPKDRGLCCVVWIIEQRYTGSFIVLIPFTARGWPSRDMRKHQYYPISMLDKLKPLTKDGANKRLMVCPDCKKLGKTLFQAPLRQLSIYYKIYQCQVCKEKFTI